MHNSDDTRRFESLFLQHLNAAYNLARWLTRSESAAQDIVQESCLRAFKSLHRFAGGNARAWLLTIVRNQSYTWLKNAAGERHVDIDDEEGLSERDKANLSHGETPEAIAVRAQDKGRLLKAMEALSPAFREVIVLKELEDMAYKEIAAVTGVPISTLR